MAANAESPALQADVSSWSSVVTTGNTLRDGTGTITDIFTSPSDGAFVYQIEFAPTGDNNPTVARIFYYNGSAWKYWRTVELPATNSDPLTPDSLVVVPIHKKIAASRKLGFTITQSVGGGWQAGAIADGYTTIL